MTFTAIIPDLPGLVKALPATLTLTPGQLLIGALNRLLFDLNPALKSSWWHWHLAGMAHRLEACATKGGGR